MRLDYSGLKDQSKFTLTDFDWADSKQLLNNGGHYKIIWAKESDLVIWVDGYKMNLNRNQIVFCTPLNILKLDKASGIIAALFNREFYCIRDHDEEVSCNGFLFYGSSLPMVLDLDEKEIKSFELMFLMFQEELETIDSVQGEMLRVLLKRLLIKATRLIKMKSPQENLPKPQYDIVRRYHLLVEKYFRNLHSVAAYAELLFKSPKTLSNLFKKLGKESPSQIINERITLEAKRLLLFSDKTAEEIGYELGFKEAAHFSKFFKKQVGLPPLVFKKENNT